MKKVNKKGFVLAETITISVVVITALVIIYTQFINVDNSYYRTFNYNNVNNLYLVNQVKEFMNNEPSLYDGITNDNLYLDITNCSSYFIEYMYCENLINSIGAKRVILTENDTTNLSNNLENYDFSEVMKRFIEDNRTNEEGYRIIVEFNDNTIASLSIPKSSSIKSYNIGDIVTLTTGTDTTSTWYVIRDNGDTLRLLKATNIDDNTYVFGNSINYNTSALKSEVDGYGASLGIPEVSSSIRLITIDELISLGCTQDSDEYRCDSTYSWLYSSEYWTMSASDIVGSTSDIWVVKANGDVIVDGIAYDYGIRPVIEVSKDIVE